MKPPFPSRFAPPLVKRRTSAAVFRALSRSARPLPRAGHLCGAGRDFSNKGLSRRTRVTARAALSYASHRARLVAQALLSAAHVRPAGDDRCRATASTMRSSCSALSSPRTRRAGVVAFPDEPGLRKVEAHFRRHAPGAGLCSERQGVRQGARRHRPEGRAIGGRHRAARGKQRRAFVRSPRHRADPGGRPRPGRRRARHDRQNSLHLRLHRHAQGRDQHPPHDVLEPDDGRADLEFRENGADRARRLVALEPHFGGNHDFNLVLAQGGTLTSRPPARRRT